MELEVAPEPSDAERAALEAALKDVEEVDGGPPASYRSAWRRAALDDVLEDLDSKP